MKKIIFFGFSIFLFSCAPKTTKDQNDAYNTCKKTILDNPKLFLVGATTKEKEDSLKKYMDDLRECNLDQLVNRYDIAPEEVNVLVYSVCTKADGVKNILTIEKEIKKTDSLLRDIDSRSELDSLHLPGANK